MSGRGMWRIGVDIGGTFTDGVLVTPDGDVLVAKVSSTPSSLSDAFCEVVRRLLAAAGCRGSDIEYVAHGTTVATNAVINRNLARTGLITTKGFRDVLEIARQVRPDPYDVFAEKPPPLVSRDLCREVGGRMDAQGRELASLDAEDVRAAATHFSSTGVAAVAVCLIHSYVNSKHEAMVGEMLRELLPGVPVSLSADLASEFREFPRACTAAINAGLVPVVGAYLERLQESLRGMGVTTDCRVMQSNGGVVAAESARRRPVHLLESGPAAGVMGAAHLARACGEQNLLSFDMGGTTAKLGVIRGGEPEMVRQFEVGRDANQAREWFTGATGYPVMIPAVDLVEIGAGGGSVAWIDSGGVLRVGPRSAGADPGPVCYACGGLEPTVTDANVVLGRLNPTYFLGGELKLDYDAAVAAVRSLAERLGIDVYETALGVISVAEAAMVRAMRVVSVQRGYDPRDFALVAFGGAGPVHAVALAGEMGIPRVIVPNRPGLASAMGLLVTDLKHDYAVTRIGRIDHADVGAMEAAFALLEEDGRRILRDEGVEKSATRIERRVDVRYLGQSYELTLPVPRTPLNRAALEELKRAFDTAHDAAYGYAEPSEPKELVNLRVTAIGTVPKPRLVPRDVESTDDAPASERSVYFKESGFVPARIVRRHSLEADAAIVGPAVVESADSTVVIPDGWRASLDRAMNLVIVSDAGTTQVAAG